MTDTDIEGYTCNPLYRKRRNKQSREWSWTPGSSGWGGDSSRDESRSHCTLVTWVSGSTLRLWAWTRPHISVHSPTPWPRLQCHCSRAKHHLVPTCQQWTAPLKAARLYTAHAPQEYSHADKRKYCYQRKESHVPTQAPHAGQWRPLKWPSQYHL